MESLSRKLICEEPLKNGLAFPTGISKNFIAAHFTPETDSEMTIEENDLLKIDFGIHKNGHIVDCAFSFSFDDRYKELIETVKS